MKLPWATAQLKVVPEEKVAMVQVSDCFQKEAFVPLSGSPPRTLKSRKTRTGLSDEPMVAVVDWKASAFQPMPGPNPLVLLSQALCSCQ